jgi:pimeloyl-ACP methyl ester carboxylesterase
MPRGVPRGGQLLSAHPPAAAISGVRVPVTLVLGDLGQRLFHRTTRRTAHLLPHARTVAITGTGHLIPTDQPEAFAAVVAACLAEASRQTE